MLAIMRSGVSAWALKMNSRSRRGSPLQAQKASCTVSRGAKLRVGDGEVGQQFCSGVSQLSRPASTRVAASSELNDLVTEPMRSRCQE